MNKNTSDTFEKIIIGPDHHISWKQVAKASQMEKSFQIELSVEAKKRTEYSFSCLTKRIEEEKIEVYGITTGFGDNARRSIPLESQKELQKNLLEYLDCAFGPSASYSISKATLLLRIISFSQGYSAVNPEMIYRLVDIFNSGYVPVLPLEGSLGASGDLIPLASVGQCLRGCGEVYTPDGKKVQSRVLLEKLNQSPYVFSGKDALGLVNGTSLMTAIACYCLDTFKKAWDWSEYSISTLVWALKAHPSGFSPLVNENAKKHPGQSYVAKRVRELCEWDQFDFVVHRNPGEHKDSLQDPYGIRCAPQILGPCLEVFEQAVLMVEREINSANDNPLVELKTGALSSGGNFYGGYISLAMEQISWASAHMADLLDRQILLAVHERSNRGLPPNLTGIAHFNEDPSAFAHHGLKGVHQYANAITAEVVRMAVPCSIFSRSSESHNQDKISLGTHSARNTEKQLVLLTRLVALHSACSSQAAELRGSNLPNELQVWFAKVRSVFSFVKHDRTLKEELNNLQSLVLNLSPEIESQEEAKRAA